MLIYQGLMGTRITCTPLCTPNLLKKEIHLSFINDERILVALSSSSSSECAYAFITISGVSPIILATVVTATPSAIKYSQKCVSIYVQKIFLFF